MDEPRLEHVSQIYVNETENIPDCPDLMLELADDAREVLDCALSALTLRLIP